MRSISPSFARHGCALGLLGLALLMTGCVANPYVQFYKPAEGVIPSLLYPYSGKTQVFGTSEERTREDLDNVAARGYGMLGYASFYWTGNAQPGEAQALEQAKLLGADIVLLRSNFVGSEQTVVPYVTVTPGQTTTTTYSGNANANVYGSTNSVYNTPYGTVTGTSNSSGYGNASYNGMATTTSAPTYNTQMIPVTRDKYEYAAFYFRKRVYLFGANYEPLTPELRQTLQRNSGLLVTKILDGTPAFNANVLPGDVLLTINEDTVTTREAFGELLEKYKGQEVALGILRGGAPKTIKLKVGTHPTPPAPEKKG